MTEIRIRSSGLRKPLTVTKLEGRPNEWLATMKGYLPETIRANGPGEAVDAAIGASVQFSKDANIVKKPRSEAQIANAKRLGESARKPKSEPASVPMKPEKPKEAKTVA